MDDDTSPILSFRHGDSNTRVYKLLGFAAVVAVLVAVIITPAIVTMTRTNDIKSQNSGLDSNLRALNKTLNTTVNEVNQVIDKNNALQDKLDSLKRVMRITANALLAMFEANFIECGDKDYLYAKFTTEKIVNTPDKNPISWNKASTICGGVNSELAVPWNAKAWDAMKEVCPNNGGPCWVGLTRIEGTGTNATWKTPDGEEFHVPQSYWQGYPDEPGVGNCVYMLNSHLLTAECQGVPKKENSTAPPVSSVFICQQSTTVAY